MPGERPDGLADVAGSGLRPQAVLFDNDGLLLDTEVVWTRAEVVLFQRHGETFTLEHKREMIGTSVTESTAISSASSTRPAEGRS